MPNRTLSVAFFLSAAFAASCASQAPAVRAAAPETAREEAPPPRRATTLAIARPQGWRQTEAADGSAIFLSNGARAVIRFSLRPADGSPADAARREAAELARAGYRVGAVDASSGETFASVDWSGDLGAGPRDGRIAVRRPTGSPGSLIVMSAYWPAGADPGLADEIGLIMLLTSAN